MKFDATIPTCPYCNYRNEEWYRVTNMDNPYEGENVETQCMSCDKEYLLHYSSTLYFKSEPKKLKEGEYDNSDD